jgi:hypothetical protein
MIENGVPSSTGDTYSWSITGGSPFANYTANNSAATYTPWISTNTPYTNCYFAKPEDDISITANVTIPSINLSFTVQELVGAVPPAFNANAIQGNPTLMPNWQTANELMLYGAVYGTNVWGIFWVGNVNTPAPFDGSGKGSWMWTNMVSNTTRWWKTANGDYYDADSNGVSNVLDTQHPYGSPHPANGSTVFDSDAPKIPLGGYVEAYVSDNFKAYMLYSAPGDSKLVPLTTIAWSWSAGAIFLNPGWGLSSSNKGTTMGDNYPGHPIWTDNVANYINKHKK